jgi:hypothetical protein
LTARKGSVLFCKKEPKNPFSLVPRTDVSGHTMSWGGSKSFCFFFQKEALSLRLFLRFLADSRARWRGCLVFRT